MSDRLGKPLLNTDVMLAKVVSATQDDGLTDLQKDQITALQQNYRWSPEAIAKAIKVPQEQVAQFLAPTKQPHKPAPHIVKPAPDIDSLIGNIRAILQLADHDQATLTQRYIDVGRLLNDLKATCKHGEFERLLTQSFPDRSLSTLHEYKTLATSFDAADDGTKVQLAGDFKHGWKAVLEEIRNLKRRAKKPADPATIPGHLSERARIIHGNCLDVLPTITEPHILITDPPYNQGVGYDGYDDCLPPDEYRNMLISVGSGPSSSYTPRRPSIYLAAVLSGDVSKS